MGDPRSASGLEFTKGSVGLQVVVGVSQRRCHGVSGVLHEASGNLKAFQGLSREGPRDVLRYFLGKFLGWPMVFWGVARSFQDVSYGIRCITGGSKGFQGCFSGL